MASMQTPDSHAVDPSKWNLIVTVGPLTSQGPVLSYQSTRHLDILTYNPTSGASRESTSRFEKEVARMVCLLLVYG